ncbi:MAG: ABC transporter ATP-binding protein [Variibacter sp.]|nr:ABC transporter ATP-binding protein [Variibacter sp.]
MTSAAPAAPLVNVEAVSKHFPVRAGLLAKRVLKAVDDVSFTIGKGETLGLVGESGSGKSTLGRVIVNLLPATSGSIKLSDREVAQLRGAARRELWRHVQMVFQDPYSSLNPKMTVRDALAEPLRNFGLARGAEADRLILKVLEDCGLPSRAMDLYPREFSGGQRQRIGIARALILRPDFIVADEPVSALDVSIQAQIINLLQDLQAEYGLTYLFIAHDLAVVRHIANRVAVMYLGKIVELAASDALYERPRHPYTQLLLRSIPIPDPVLEARRALASSSQESSPKTSSAGGCPFSPRCPRAQFPLCGEVAPALEPKAAGHLAACHFADAG